ncbi:MAG: DUF4167 domain-containing protein [Rhodovarius sp.]|nr:DUF4167 domain-containing protein [Rhodovarius sp.]MCX7931039.1 DUF4167 domain-containing protein [Rhodovarius sp.]MDW8315968.1 DUF4167 domain-containing protein [Rhodovarius sp.]
MNMKRMRGRGFRQGGGQFRHQGGGQLPLNRNHVFDSNGPDVRVRGTAQQLFEKYLQLGRDATSAGDRVMAEAYFQHAEHYFRVLAAMNQAQQQAHAGRNARQVPISEGALETPADAAVVIEEPANLAAELEAELAAENAADQAAEGQR